MEARSVSPNVINTTEICDLLLLGSVHNLISTFGRTILLYLFISRNWKIILTLSNLDISTYGDFLWPTISGV